MKFYVMKRPELIDKIYFQIYGSCFKCYSLGDLSHSSMLNETKKKLISQSVKCTDNSTETNYRPVSVLPVFSKIFEKVFETQLSDFFDTISNPFLCALKPLKGPSELMLYNNFCLVLHANLLEV
jgi:hypothetical protein